MVKSVQQNKEKEAYLFTRCLCPLPPTFTATNASRSRDDDDNRSVVVAALMVVVMVEGTLVTQMYGSFPQRMVVVVVIA